MRPAAKVSLAVIVPAVAILPNKLLGVSVKLALVPTVKLGVDAVLVMAKSGACTTVFTIDDVLLPAPVRPGSSGSVMPAGTMAMAMFDKVPVCGTVPWIVKVTELPAGKVVMVLETLLPVTATAPQAAPDVGVPHIAVTPLMAAGTESVKTVRFAASGPALLTVDV